MTSPVLMEGLDNLLKAVEKLVIIIKEQQRRIGALENEVAQLKGESK